MRLRAGCALPRLLPTSAPTRALARPYARRYTFSIYYTLTTMTTVGFGDIVAGTDSERVLAMVLQLMGCIQVPTDRPLPPRSPPPAAPRGAYQPAWSSLSRPFACRLARPPDLSRLWHHHDTIKLKRLLSNARAP